MQKKVFISLISLSAFAFASASASGVQATDRTDHFKGKEAPSWNVAHGNLTQYNQRLTEVLSKETLTAQDLAQVHELTYTLENALERMSQTLSDTAEILEKVHVASETNQPQTVKTEGANYLEAVKHMQP